MLRLAIGGLSHLAATPAGRQHVIGSKAIEAVMLGMRAHGSDAQVLDEACRFVAALAYGGADGRRAAIEAKADEMLAVAVKRFGGAAQYAQTVSMAKTILDKLNAAKESPRVEDIS